MAVCVGVLRRCQAVHGSRPVARLNSLRRKGASAASVGTDGAGLRLFTAENPGEATGEPFDDLNPASRQPLTGCKAEAALADSEPGQVLQFERLGYFALDPRTPMYFHRTVGLRDELANIRNRQK